MRTRLIGGGIVAALAVLILAGLLVHPSGGSTPAQAAKPGHEAPDFTLSSASGRSVSLSSLRGKVVLINFFATWCIPCRHELPLINRAYAQHKGNLTVLAIDKQEPDGDVRSFAQDLHLGFTPLLDPSLSVWQRYHVVVQPESFWIDRSGVVRAVDYAMDAGTIRRELKRLGVA